MSGYVYQSHSQPDNQPYDEIDEYYELEDDNLDYTHNPSQPVYDGGNDQEYYQSPKPNPYIRPQFSGRNTNFGPLGVVTENVYSCTAFL